MYKALIRAQQAKNTSSAPKIHYLVSSKMKSLVALACPNQNPVLLDLGDVSILYLYNLKLIRRCTIYKWEIDKVVNQKTY
jgi:hypothetical protein